jgi:hypothetical protein
MAVGGGGGGWGEPFSSWWAESRERNKKGSASCEPLPPAGAPFLKIPGPPNIVPAAGDQALQHTIL